MRKRPVSHSAEVPPTALLTATVPASRAPLRAQSGLLLAILVTATCASDGTGPQPDEIVPPAPEALSVLFIGNSLTYTNDLPAMLSALLEDGGHGPVDVRASAFPNYGLQDHWVTSVTRDAIAVGGWDYVALQQGPSATEGRPSLLEYAARFDQEIRNAGGQTALYMVWPSSARAFDFDGVSDSYATAADNVSGVLFAAGEAWRAAWRVDESLLLYGGDGFHPSVLGTYLAALAIYQRITGATERDVPAQIRRGSDVVTIDEALADLLFAAAVEANGLFPDL